MAEDPTIEDNYSFDYSAYYLDFTSSIGEEDLGMEEADTASSVSRQQAIQAFRDAAQQLAEQRGITVEAARQLLKSKPALRVKWMGEDMASAWQNRNSLGGGSGSGGSGGGDGSKFGDVISRMGLADGIFNSLIDKAVRNGWSAERFRSAVYQSPQFEAMFPGIKRPDGSIRMSAIEYRQLADSYSAVAKEFGVSMSGARVGALIEGAVSPQEFYQRVSVFEKVKANPGLKDAFNEQVGQFGLKPLDDSDWFKFLAGVGSKDYYDVYEAAQLRSSGLNIDATTAKGVAQNIGEVGAPLNIQELVSQARTMLADIGPELLRESISDADLVQMSAGYDPRGLEPKLRTIVANRRATGQMVMGNRATSSGESTAIYTREDAAAY